MSWKRAAACVVLVGCAGPAAAVPGPSWADARAQAKAAYERGDDAAYRAALGRMYELSGSATVLLRMARADAKLAGARRVARLRAAARGPADGGRRV